MHSEDSEKHIKITKHHADNNCKNYNLSRTE
uniref:Uncharacterized protein n=1 Tax=Arundo donax TaxID=35708 RepID=A0A0A9A4N8_ARUDO